MEKTDGIKEIPSIEEIMERFKVAGRFTAKPAVKETDFEAVSIQLHYTFPADYRKIMTTASFYKANIHFIRPERWDEDNSFIIFARWNEAKFAFSDKVANDEAVYMLIGEFREKKYNSFREWFLMVWETATQPFGSE